MVIDWLQQVTELVVIAHVVLLCYVGGSRTRIPRVQLEN